MAISLECSEYIPHYSPAEVFEVGSLFETLPREEGFVLQTEADRFAEGVLVCLTMAVAGHDFRLNSRVTEYIQNEHVKIEGSSRIGRAALWLDLSPDKQFEGTQVCFGLKIQHGLSTRFAEPRVARYLKEVLPGYTALYKQNITNKLDELSITHKLAV